MSPYPGRDAADDAVDEVRRRPNFDRDFRFFCQERGLTVTTSEPEARWIRVVALADLKAAYAAEDRRLAAHPGGSPIHRGPLSSPTSGEFSGEVTGEVTGHADAKRYTTAMGKAADAAVLSLDQTVTAMTRGQVAGAVIGHLQRASEQAQLMAAAIAVALEVLGHHDLVADGYAAAPDAGGQDWTTRE